MIQSITTNFVNYLISGRKKKDPKFIIFHFLANKQSVIKPQKSDYRQVHMESGNQPFYFFSKIRSKMHYPQKSKQKLRAQYERQELSQKIKIPNSITKARVDCQSKVVSS